MHAAFHKFIIGIRKTRKKKKTEKIKGFKVVCKVVESFGAGLVEWKLVCQIESHDNKLVNNISFCLFYVCTIVNVGFWLVSKNPFVTNN